MAYSLAAVGVVIIFNVVRAFQFAQGAVVMFAAYIFAEFYLSFHWNLALSLLMLIAAMVVFSFAISPLIFEPLLGRPFPSLIGSLGILLVLTEVVGRYFFSGQAVAYPETLKPDGAFELGGTSFSYRELLVLGCAIVGVGLLDVFFHHSRAGIQMRALADTRIGAQICGIHTKRHIRLGFVVAGLAAALGGLLLGMLLSNISPDLGNDLTFKAVAAVLVAGSTSFRGAILASLIIGVAESLAVGYFQPTYSSAVAYVVIVVVLLFRPNGLFEAPVEHEAETA